MSAFIFQKMQSREDYEFLEDFAKFGHEIRASEYQIGLAPIEQIKQLMTWAWSEACAFWLIKESGTGKTIIRMNAKVRDDNPSQGTIGFFEADLSSAVLKDAFEFAITHTLDWLKSKDVNQVIAPVDISTWFNYRFSLPGKKFFPRHEWEPTTPPEYLKMFKEYGFQNYAHYQSVYFPYYKIFNFYIGERYLKNGYKALHDQGFSLRAFDQEHLMAKEVPLFHSITHEAFSDAFMFEPLTLETFTRLYATSKNYDSSPSCVLVSPEGEDIGFMYAFYDGDYVVIKSIAIRKKYQGLKLSSGMIYHAVKMSFAHKKKATISALFKTGIASEKIGNNSKPLWFSWTHDYVLVKKELENE